MEELKLILQTMSSLGGEAKEAFIWWLVFDKLVPAVCFLTGLLAALWITLKIVMVCSYERELQLIRDAMGVGSRGPVVLEELRAMEAWIRERREIKK